VRESLSDIPRLREPVGEKDHVEGPAGVRVTLLEYGDYQCPYCGEAYPIVKKIQEKYSDSLRFVFRNFPLTQVHPFAETGAEIAEAAAAQGKFWEMHDFLYENQQHLSSVEYFLQYAETKLGLDAKKMREEISNHVYLPRIRQDFSTGVRSGVNGTPTFFINDFRHNGDYEFDTLAEAIEKVLSAGAANQRTSKTTASRKRATRKKSSRKKVKAR
jgi:protein-disulfide isomerase